MTYFVACLAALSMSSAAISTTATQTHYSHNHCNTTIDKVCYFFASGAPQDYKTGIVDMQLFTGWRSGCPRPLKQEIRLLSMPRDQRWTVESTGPLATRDAIISLLKIFRQRPPVRNTARNVGYFTRGFKPSLTGCRSRSSYYSMPPFPI